MQIQSAQGPGFVQNAAKNTRQLAKILEKLSTAMSINRASDDAAGLAVSEQLRTQIRGFKAAGQNITDAMSALNIGEGAANEVSSMLQRQRELTIQAKSDTVNNSQRQDLDVEYQALSAEINRISNTTQFNRQNAGAGRDLSSGTAQVQVGANAGDSISLPPVDMTVAALGVSGTSIATAAQASTALASIDTALNSLNNQRSNVGAMINRFESAYNNLSVSEVNTQAAESALRDQDMASGMAELVRAQLLQDGGNRSFARYNEISRTNLLSLMQ